MVRKLKLIEVALPLDVINAESEKDGPKRKNHPWRIHYWWARRKLATARAVLFAQLVDDPSARPDEFPTEELQRKERERLHHLLERLASWENVQDDRLFADARNEILKSSNGTPPALMDPFAGGGSIPLEAQRLGIEAYASDLNPVAVLINKALLEIPPQFKNRAPAFPGLAEAEIRHWKGAQGLAADVRAYGAWIRSEAIKKLGHNYPEALLPDGTAVPVMAWLWARTVKCPNPACGAEMPLVRSWWLGKRKGREAFIEPVVTNHSFPGSAPTIEFRVRKAKIRPAGTPDGTVGRTGARCIACNGPVKLEYIRSASRESGLGAQMMAMIVEGDRQRHYLPPDEIQEASSLVDTTNGAPPGELFDWPGRINVYRYGLTHFTDLFTARQLLALTTLSDLVIEARESVRSDSGDAAYADAVATYLGLAVSRCADYQSNITTWHYQNEQIRDVFARQAIPMAWDFLEVNPLGNGSGTWISQVELSAQALDGLNVDVPGHAKQAAAQNADFHGMLVSTDPPYYDNVGYADLSDFFYVWLRRTLRPVYPDLLSTILVPKSEELVANPFRLGGRENAKSFFEEGFRQVFANAREHALSDYPMTVYYAFKQSEISDDGQASSGWETLLEGMVDSGWEITSTWPFRTETASRMLAQGSNALASSIVLSLRPRSTDAVTTDRRGFILELEKELPNALRKLQQGRIAPVDLAQAAIGPGMAVYSRYEAVLEADGRRMPVRAALARINEVLDRVLNEQEGDFDAASRFAIAWYRQNGYEIGKFGVADDLARALNTSVDVMERHGVLQSRAGKVVLTKPHDFSDQYDPVSDTHISNWEVLHYLIKILEDDGVDAAGDFLRVALNRTDAVVDRDLLKELAHLLFRIAEGKSWTQDALSFNSLVTSWPDIVHSASSLDSQLRDNQTAMVFPEEVD